MYNIHIVSKSTLNELKASFGQCIVYHDFSSEFMNVIAISNGSNIMLENELYIADTDVLKILRTVLIPKA